MIFGSRIKQAREYLGETQTHFGEQVGLRQAAVSRAESSVAPLPEDVLMAMAEHTGFPPSFFQTPRASHVEEYQFRARLRFKVADRNRAIRCAEIVHESYELMRREVTTVAVRLPVLPNADPVRAARIVRGELGADPYAPIPNVTLPIERLGVVVLALPVTTQKHEAFCWWHRDRRKPYPVIATLKGSPGDRLRWSIAHELGHAVLHADGGASQDIERQADAFAAELLTPLDALRGEMPRRPKLSALYAMKIRWGVSAQSLIRRGHELGAIDDDQKMSLFRQISARGERMNERYQIRREKPRAYRKMAEVLFGESPTRGLAELARWTPEFAQDVLDQYAAPTELPSRRSVVPAKPHASNVIPLRRK